MDISASITSVLRFIKPSMNQSGCFDLEARSMCFAFCRFL